MTAAVRQEGEQFPQISHRQQAIGGEGHAVLELEMDAELGPAQAVEAEACDRKSGDRQGAGGGAPGREVVTKLSKPRRRHGNGRQGGDQQRQGRKGKAGRQELRPPA